jgi:hypothetical protein
VGDLEKISKGTLKNFEGDLEKFFKGEEGRKNDWRGTLPSKWS